MTKKFIISLTLLFLTLFGFSQSVVQRTPGTQTVEDMRLMAGWNLFVPIFSDTTSANAQKGVDSVGAIIFDRSINGLRVRRGGVSKHWDYITDSTVFATLLAVKDTAINIRIALVDSVNVLKGLITSKGGGSVDTVYTGFGITGGAITTVGTLKADTSAGKLSTQYYVNSRGFLTANQPIIVIATGDASGTSSSSSTNPVLNLTLATTNLSPNTYGDASHTLQQTVNGKGLSTSVVSLPISITQSQISNPNVTGLISAGAAISISGSGTSASPYIINSTGSDTSILVTTTALNDTLLNYLKAPVANSSLQHSSIFVTPTGGLTVGSGGVLTLGNTVAIGIDTTSTIATKYYVNTHSGGGGSGTLNNNYVVPTAVKNGNYKAVAHDYVPVDNSSGNLVDTLPTAPNDSTVIGFKMVTQGSANTVTILTGSGDVFNKVGGTTTNTLNVLNESRLYQYKKSIGVWYAIVDGVPASATILKKDSAVTYVTPNNLRVDSIALAGRTLQQVTDKGNNTTDSINIKSPTQNDVSIYSENTGIGGYRGRIDLYTDNTGGKTIVVDGFLTSQSISGVRGTNAINYSTAGVGRTDNFQLPDTSGYPIISINGNTGNSKGAITISGLGTDTTVNITSVTPTIVGKVKTFTIPYSAITGNKIIAGTNTTVTHNPDSSYTVNATGTTPTLQAVTAIGNSTNLGINLLPVISTIPTPAHGHTITDSFGIIIIDSANKRLRLSQNQQTANTLIIDSLQNKSGQLALVGDTSTYIVTPTKLNAKPIIKDTTLINNGVTNSPLGVNLGYVASQFGLLPNSTNTFTIGNLPYMNPLTPFITSVMNITVSTDASGNITFPNISSNDYVHYYYTFFNSQLPNWDFERNILVTTVGAGIGLGKLAETFPSFDRVGTTAFGRLRLASNGPTTPVFVDSTIATIPFYNGQVLILKTLFDKDTVYYSVKDSATGASLSSKYGTDFSGSTPNSNFMQTGGSYIIFQKGGAYVVRGSNLVLKSATLGGANLYGVGDSKSAGLVAPNPQSRFFQMYNDSVATLINLSSSGAASADCLQRLNQEIIPYVKPACIIASFGSNDLRTSYAVPTATWQANIVQYDSICQRNNIRVVWMCPWETNTNLDPLDSFLFAKFPTRYIRSVYTAMKAYGTGCLSPADFIHPNAIGNNIIFQQMKASTMIPAGNYSKPAPQYLAPGVVPESVGYGYQNSGIYVGQQSTNFNYLGFGTATPAYRFDFTDANNNLFNINNTSTTSTFGGSGVYMTNFANLGILQKNPPTFSPFGTLNPNDLMLMNNTGGDLDINEFPNGHIKLSIAAASTPAIDITSSTLSLAYLTSIRGITYAFPTVAPTTGQVLTATNSTGGVLGWQNTPIILSTTTGINAKTTGSTALYTVPTGKTLTITSVVVHVVSATAITNGATASIDSASTTNYFFPATGMTALTSTPSNFTFTGNGMGKDGVAGTVVNFNITSAATGTSEALKVELIGYLQ